MLGAVGLFHDLHVRPPKQTDVHRLLVPTVLVSIRKRRVAGSPDEAVGRRRLTSRKDSTTSKTNHSGDLLPSSAVIRSRTAGILVHTGTIVIGPKASSDGAEPPVREYSRAHGHPAREGPSPSPSSRATPSHSPSERSTPIPQYCARRRRRRYLQHQSQRAATRSVRTRSEKRRRGGGRRQEALDHDVCAKCKKYAHHGAVVAVSCKNIGLCAPGLNRCAII